LPTPEGPRRRRLDFSMMDWEVLVVRRVVESRSISEEEDVW